MVLALGGGVPQRPDWARQIPQPYPSHRLRHSSQSARANISFYEQCEVQRAEWKGNAWQVHCRTGADHTCIAHLPLDRLWLATGSQLDVTHWPLLAAVQASQPAEIVNGLPVLDHHLRWPGCNLFVMGGAAALQLGPAARNLFGGRLASERIVPALVKSSLAAA